MAANGNPSDKRGNGKALVVAKVCGSNIEITDMPDGESWTPLHALTFTGQWLGGKSDEITVIVDLRAAGIIIAGLRMMYAQHEGYTQKLDEAVQRVMIKRDV
jgi:hypothetical protein